MLGSRVLQGDFTRRVCGALVACACAAAFLVVPTETVFAGTSSEEVTSIPVYRLYNPSSGEHLYTTDAYERDVLSGGRMWHYEGVAWVSPSESDMPVYRLYNPVTTEHHYTADDVERRVLTTRDGWKEEGVTWYSTDSSGVPIYRQFFPTLTVGAHHYTSDFTEYTINNTRGWQGENIAFYALEEGWAPGNEPVYVSMGVTVSDTDGSDADTFTIPEATGLRYKVNGEDIDAGTYKVRDYYTYTNHHAVVRVTAKVVEDGYRIRGGVAGSIYVHDVDDYIKVSTQPVTFSDNNASNNDTFTVPNVIGVQYKAGNKNVNAGTYKVEDYFDYESDYWAHPHITAVAKDGYSLVGDTSWTQDIDGRTEVTPDEVSFTDNDGQALDSFTIPSATGVQYQIDGKTISAGTYKVKDYFTYTNYMADVTVIADPAPGYKLPDDVITAWECIFDGYTTVATVAPTGNDVSGMRSDTFTIPDVAGVRYIVKGVNMAPGEHGIVTRDAQGNAIVIITAEPHAGYKLTGEQTWTLNYTADVFPEPVIFTDPVGSTSDTVTIPNVEGVYYTIDGLRKAPGTYTVTSQIGTYSNHHREMSVHAYAESGYTLKSDSQVYYFHKFTDGQQTTLPKAKKSSSDYGDYTVAQAKAKTEQVHNALVAEINAGSDYALRTSIGELYGVTQDTVNLPSTPTTLDDRTREINRRYALRYQQRVDAFRAEFGLESIQLANLTPEAEELAYAHAVATWNYNTPNIVGHYMDDPNLKSLEARNNNGQGLDFDGTYGVAENLAFYSSSDLDITPEEMADRSFAGYISEYPDLDGTFNSKNGHLVNILTDNYSVHANYMYVAPFQRQVIGQQYTWENGIWVPRDVYGTMIQLMSVQTPGATWYR